MMIFLINFKLYLLVDIFYNRTYDSNSKNAMPSTKWGGKYSGVINKDCCVDLLGIYSKNLIITITEP